MLKKTFEPPFAFLKRVDYFGVPFEVTHLGRQFTKTMFGGVLTLLVFLCLAGYFASTVFSVLSHSNPNIIEEEIYATKDRGFNLSEHGFSFTIRVDYNNVPVNLSDPNEEVFRYFRIDLDKVEKYTNPKNKTDTKKSTEKIPTATCTLQDNLGKMTQEEFEAKGIGNDLCSRSNNLTVAGQYGTEYFIYIRLRINVCDQTVENNTCEKDPQAVFNKLSNGNIVITWYFLDADLNLKEYKHPLTFYMMISEFWFLSPNIVTEHNLFFKDFTVQTQQGALITGFRNQTFYRYDYQDSYQYSREISSDTEFLSSYLRVSQNSVTVRRTYATMLDGLSAVGGLFTVLTAILSIPLIIYTRWVQVRSIAKRLTYYDVRKALKFVKEERKGSSSVPDSKELESLSGDEDIDLNLLKEVGSMNKPPTYSDWFKSTAFPFLKPKTEKDKFIEKMVEKSVQRVSSRLDSYHLAKGFQELQFLKALLMNKEQIAIFNSVTYPEVFENDGENEESLFDYSGKADFTEEELTRAFKTLKTSDDPISKGLLKNMTTIYKLAFKKMEEKEGKSALSSPPNPSEKV